MSAASGRVYAAIGFQAKLEPLPLLISGYDEEPDRYSAAIYPLTFPVLSSRLIRSPHATESNFAANSIRFETVYFRQGVLKKSFVPVSVDAANYLQYRTEKEQKRKLSELSMSAISSPEEKKGRGGLGISVGLPKRLDKIFGEGGAGLRVNGRRRITFSGRSQWTDAAESDNYRQNKFPSLNMEQISKFDITGTIGTKITVKVAQNSQTETPLANRLQIRYKGDEDDILKVVEAGNTDLRLPNTRFVGYSQRIQGLFGIKAIAQVGNLTMTVIASQEKGSSDQTTYSASGEESADYIRDTEYARNRIFDLAYSNNALGYPDQFEVGDSITKLVVYEQIDRVRDDENVASSFEAVLFVDPNNPDRDVVFPSERKRDILMKEMDVTSYFPYEVHPETGIPYVVFKQQRTPSKSLAFYMEFKKPGDTSALKIGDIDLARDTLFLKVLRLTNPNPSFTSWSLMWRNCYIMPRGIPIDDLDMKIFKGLSGTERSTSKNLDYQDVNGKVRNYLEVFGLDQYNTANQKGADGRMDNRSEIFRDDWGLLVFPNRQPFNTDTVYTGSDPLDVKVPQIYESISSQTVAQSSKYYLQISSQTRKAIIKLNRTNIIEGSERIMVNGRQLKKGTDYNIQYDFGQVTLISQEALDPNAELTINYEYAPFFSIQKKTLMGARLEYEWSPDLKFGSTVLHKSDKQQERKPKVGQETATMTVFDFDTQWKLHPGFITKAVNALPFIETEVPSNLIVSAEIAQSRPNPNVDGVAYVDDFESAANLLSLGKSRTNWHEASIPIQLGRRVTDTLFNRGTLLWHNPEGGEERTFDDVYVDRETKQGENRLTTLRMVFEPDNTPQTDSGGVSTSDLPSWAGIMRYFNSRVDPEQVQLFEFRANFFGGRTGKLHFDFGQIDEDLKFHEKHKDAAFSEDSRDQNGDNGGNRNGVVDANEDVGLDGIRDENEISPDGTPYDAVTNPDPAGDNYYFPGDDVNLGNCPFPAEVCTDRTNSFWSTDFNLYRGLNGTEGNRNDPAVLGIPDQEALSSNGLNNINAYFSFKLDLATLDSTLEEGGFRISGSDKNGWNTYRLPILDFDPDSVVVVDSGDGAVEPDWALITHVRIWFEADAIDTGRTVVEIAEWQFVQSNWQDTVIIVPKNLSSDSLIPFFTVASISTEDGTFSAPPGVEAYVDPTYNVREPQRGLQLLFDSLQYLDTVMVTKQLITVDKYSGYRRMKMYVNVPRISNNSADIKMFFRFGRDNKNFYEQIRTLKESANWDEENWVDIDFQELTKVKDIALRANVTASQIDTTIGKYRVVGNPNLNEVRFYAIGLVNDDSALYANTISDVGGEIWLDELRVTDVRRDVGAAGRITATGSLADLLSYNFGYSGQDPYFRSISNATRGGSENNLGSGETRITTNYGFTFHFDKFLPRSWGANIPFSYSFTKRTDIPLLRNGTDILLPDDIREQEKSVNQSTNISINGLQFNHKGKNPIFSLFLNRLRRTSFSIGRTMRRSVTIPSAFGENISANSGFDLGVKTQPSLPIFFWTKWIPILKKTSESRLQLYPATWTVNGKFTRNINITDDISGTRRTTIKRNFSGSMNVSYKVFDNLTAGYTYRTERDLTDLDLVNISFKNTKLGLETSYAQNVTSSYDPKLLSFFTTAFNYRANYREDYDRTYEAYRSSLTSSTGIGGIFNHRKLLGGSGGSGEQRRFRGAGGRGKKNVRAGEAKKEEVTKKPFYNAPLSVLRFATGWIDPFSYSYDQSFKNSVPGIIQRPSQNYRFGFTRDPEVEVISQNRQPASSESESYSLSSGFTLLKGIKTGVAFRRSVATELVSQGDLYENTSTSWPDLTIQIRKFETLPIIKPVVNKLIDIFSPRTGFSKQRREKFNLSGGFVTEETSSTSHSPLLSVTLKLIRSLSVSGSFTLFKDESRKFNQTDGEFQSESRSIKKTVAISSKYSFSSPNGISIPLFGRLKFTSTMSIEVNFKINSDFSETASKTAPEDFVSNVDKSDITISPRISYQFSRKMRGGLTGRWQDSKDNRREQTSHIRELQIWTEFTF